MANAKSKLKHIEKRRAHDRQDPRRVLRDQKRAGTTKRVASTRAAYDRLMALRRKNPWLAKDRDLRNTYPGFGMVDYEIYFDNQEGKCASCGTLQPGGKHHRLLVDHNHITGRVRALLCDPCNKAIGHAKENPLRLEQCAAYLRLHNAK